MIFAITASVGVLHDDKRPIQDDEQVWLPPQFAEGQILKVLK